LFESDQAAMRVASDGIANGKRYRWEMATEPRHDAKSSGQPGPTGRNSSSGPAPSWPTQNADGRASQKRGLHG